MFLETNIKLIQNYTIKRKKLGYFVDQLVYTIILGSNSGSNSQKEKTLIQCIYYVLTI